MTIAKELILSKSINNAFLASMQSGKTGTINHLSELILPKTGYLESNQSIMFLTSMRDSDLKEQNIRSLESDSSNVFVMQMDKFKSFGVAEVKSNNVKLIIRDEDQYGCGKESTFDRGFFNNVRNLIPDIPLLSVSATPFDILDAREKGLSVNVIYGHRHNNYFGISEMLKEGNIYDLPDNYEHIKAQGDTTIISNEIKSSIIHLNKSQKGIGIIRCSDTAQAIKLKDQFNSLNENGIETIVIGCRSEADHNIKDGLRLLSRKLRRENKKIILLVIHALSAGKDLKSLKNHIKFVIETRKTQVSNCVQGLPGRVCGYHSNRDLMVFANKDILEYYSDFENEPSIFNNEDWIDTLYNDEKVKSLTSQTKFYLFQKEEIQIPIKDAFEIPVEDLFSNEAEKIMSFLNEDEFRKLLKYFDKKVYDEDLRVGGLKNKKVQLRISSNYKKYNTVFRGWKKGLNDSFRSLFSHKNRVAKYGILISNYPKDDPRNELNFCGIKIFIPGEKHYCDRLTTTKNNSMYDEDPK